MSYVDFHCHLDLYPDFEAAVRTAEAARVYTLAVTTTPRAWPRNYEVTSTSKFVRAALGLHPQIVSQYPKDVEIWSGYVDQAKFVGEVGLDAGPRFFKSLPLQQEVFVHILKSCARSSSKILTVHSIRSTKLVMDSLERHLPLREHSVVLHWFTGSASEAQRAVDLGCYFSVNSQMLTGERGRELVRRIPLERLLTETDGPFTQCSGRPANPADVESTSQEIAVVLGMSSAKFGSAVRENLRTLLIRQEHRGDSSFVVE
jgi:TatD DNase family protein